MESNSFTNLTVSQRLTCQGFVSLRAREDDSQVSVSTRFSETRDRGEVVIAAWLAWQVCRCDEAAYAAFWARPARPSLHRQGSVQAGRRSALSMMS